LSIQKLPTTKSQKPKTKKGGRLMDGEDVKIFPEIFLENAQILTKKCAKYDLQRKMSVLKATVNSKN